MTGADFFGGVRRWGGIDHYASGGVREAMLGSGRNMIWWDEPETGGEAYIPRLGDRARNRALVEVVAGWSDMVAIPKELLSAGVSFSEPGTKAAKGMAWSAPFSPAGMTAAPASSPGPTHVTFVVGEGEFNAVIDGRIEDHDGEMFRLVRVGEERYG